MEEDNKLGMKIIGGVIAASAIIGGIVINEVVDERSKQQIVEKISCDGKTCRMLWRVGADQCDALMECDGCDKSITRLQGGECDGDTNYVAPASGHELVRVLHCMERDGLIAGWSAWYPADVYVNGTMIDEAECGVDVMVKKHAVDRLAGVVGSDSAIIHSAKESYAPEWAMKDGVRGHTFSGEKVRKKK